MIHVDVCIPVPDTEIVRPARNTTVKTGREQIAVRMVPRRRKRSNYHRIIFPRSFTKPKDARIE